MECNHIAPQADAGDDTFDNCIPLCFDCHAEVGSYNAKHPKGNKFSEAELRAHRDRWYGKVRQPAPTYLDASALELDRALFSRIRGIFHHNYMLFFKEHDYGGSFPAEGHDTITDFLHESRDPAFEFLDERMQGCFQAFRDSMVAFHHSWSNRLWLDDEQLRHGRRIFSIPREWIHGRADELHPKRHDEARLALNDGSTAFYSAYVDFIRNGRRLLAVS